MSKFRPSEQAKFEALFGMASGYVLDFSDSTFASFFGSLVDINIHSDRYCEQGTSKAKKLRAFWSLEEDHIVGKVLVEMVELATTTQNPDCSLTLIEECRLIANSLLGGTSRLQQLKSVTEPFGSKYIAKQIERMDDSVQTDPALAIGTAKELIETCCRSILKDLGKDVSGNTDLSTLTKTTLKELHLVPESADDASKGKDAVKRILQNLGQIGNNIAQLRNLYGTGHGKSHTAKGLQPRHAKLAIGSAATFVTFLFETHQDRKTK